MDTVSQIDAEQLQELSSADKWVLLQHPMKCVDFGDGSGLLMRMRTVDARTGQLGVASAVIGTQEKDGELIMSIGEFAITPGI